MANNLALYNFPDSYYTNLVETAASVKYVSASGSDSNNGNTVTTPYLTIAKALTDTSATATTVTIVILAGTYVITPQANGSSYATSAITDSNKPRVFVGAPGRVKIQFTNASGYGPYAVDFQNSGSACYGIIFERNNAGKANSYEVAIFCGSSTVGNLKGNFYNCAFTETNANFNWSLQYDNESRIASQVNNCTFKFYEAAMADYSGGAGLVLNYSVFSQANPGGNSTKSNTLYSQTVDATTYVTTGVTTAGVYSGTYSWSGTTTLPAGIYANTSTIVYGGSVQFTLNSSNVTTGNVPYTISGVTSALISNASLTGNFVMSAGTGAVTVTATSGTYSNVNVMSMAADGYTANVTINPNVTIYLTSIIGISGTADSSYVEYPVLGQMNIIQSSVTTTDVTLSATPLLPVLNQQSNTVSVSYTTMTNSIAGPIDAGVIKIFGDSPQREYWM